MSHRIPPPHPTLLPWSRLSEREIQVARLLARRLTMKEMAAEMGISVKTVGQHQKHLREKLNIYTPLELIDEINKELHRGKYRITGKREEE